MENRITHKLGIYKSKESTNTDIYTNIQMEGSQRLLPPDEINKILDVTEQFNYERQNSKYYRISGKISPLISNPLFNITGNNDCWQIFNNPLFLNNPDPESTNNYTFGESIKNNLKEKDGWFGYYSILNNPASSCSKYTDMEPKRERFSFLIDLTNVQNQQIKNWDLAITYPYSSDTTHYMINNGLLIIDKVLVIVGGKPMTALSTPVFHNLNQGDNVVISGTNFDGEYLVRRIGLDNGDSKNHYFCIDVDFNTVTVGNNGRMSKVYNNVPSTYYFRKFKKVRTRSSNILQQDDYETFKIAFSNTIFYDDVVEFIFNEDIDITDTQDNLKRPLSELYLTVIKKDSGGIFSNLTSGIEAPVLQTQYWNTANTNFYLKQVPVIQKIHNVTSAPNQSFTPLENNVDFNNSDFYGDVVEYNKTTVEEIVLSDVQYRFNTVNRETTGTSLIPGPRPEGYYYKAHYQIKLKTISSYVEEGDSNTLGIPSYATDLGDGRIIWRDILDIGVTDIKNGTVNYPFLNGTHYLFDNYCFELKRQDPYDEWDMYFGLFPADPIGKKPSNKFKINISDNVC